MSNQPRPERPDVSRLSAADAEKAIARWDQAYADWCFAATAKQLTPEDQRHLAQSAVNGLREAGFQI